MAVYFVAKTEELQTGQHQIVDIDGRSIGLYNVHGEYYAIHNYCPHQGMELCKGEVCGTMLPSNVYEYIFGLDNEVVRCPVHGWEFDIKTGISLFDDKVRTRKYKVIVENGEIGIVI
jgi:nitrite reductase (NADH) small subunit